MLNCGCSESSENVWRVVTDPSQHLRSVVTDGGIFNVGTRTMKGTVHVTALFLSFVQYLAVVRFILIVTEN